MPQKVGHELKRVHLRGPFFCVPSRQPTLRNTLNKGRREHIVPCALVIEEARRMLQHGSSMEDVAKLLHENIIVVLVTDEEAETLDFVWKVSMPEGWAFGHDPYARLRACGIHLPRLRLKVSTMYQA